MGVRNQQRPRSSINIISCTKTQKYFLKGCPIFLAHVTTKKDEGKSKEKRLEDVPIVQDFPEVFPEDLSGIPPTRQVEFSKSYLLMPGAGSLRLVCQEKGWIIRMCIDYQELNKLTVKNRYPLLRIDDLFDQLQEHEEHLKLILELLKKEQLYAKFSKCEFWIPKVQFLGHVIDSQGIHVDPAKIESVKDWESPKTATEIWVTKQGTFQLIKAEVMFSLILALPEGSENFIVYYDLVDQRVGVFAKCKEKRYHAILKSSPFEHFIAGNVEVDRGGLLIEGLGLEDAQTQLSRAYCMMTTEKIVQIKQRIQAARDRQKSYADVERKPLEFQVGGPSYVKGFTLERGRTFWQTREVKPEKCLSDEPLAVPLDEIHIDDKLCFVEEPVEIMDREVKWLKESRIPIIKVLWNSRRGLSFNGNVKISSRRIMESLHLSVSRAIEAGIFKGIKIDSTLNLSHLFYADDVVFIGEWSPSNLSGITNILHCFSLLSGLSINLKKSNLLGVGVRSEYVKDAAVNLGCLTMKTPFKYLGVMVGGICATSQAWEDTIGKLKARLSNWKLKTLSVGGRLTLLKSVLGSTPIYNLSIYKAPKSVLHSMESLRRNFFNGSQCNERKIAWIKWTTTLASKKNGGLGISSLYALNRALLFKWVWRFISRDNSLWCRLILSMHGSKLPSSSPFRYSTWLSIIREIHSLKDRGVDLVSHCRIHVGNGLRTNFWKEVWIGDNPLCVLFPRIFALETNKDSSVAVKLSSVTSSLRRPVRGGSESSQLSLLQEYIEGTILSSLEDRWVWDLNGEGVFCVKDVRNLLDDVFLPKAPIATRWIKYVPIKLNVFAWKVHLNRLPTRVNLQHRGVLVSDPSCPICHSEDEDLAHLFFRCSLVTDIVRLVCRWWNIAWASIDSYSNWLHWFNAIRLSPKVKDLLEGVFYITWWSIWRFRNQVLFSSLVPRKDVLFDDIEIRILKKQNDDLTKKMEEERVAAKDQREADLLEWKKTLVIDTRFAKEVMKAKYARTRRFIGAWFDNLTPTPIPTFCKRWQAAFVK
ncbi:RNA-directed DNA polymerase, eukaryota [Tanacetum coccineum]